ncbi:MAG: IMP dehydrogenase [Acidilobaceae archaeon]
MKIREYITFDDVAIVPGKAVIEPSDVDLTSKFSKNIEVYIPVVSSPMDTVTEWRLALALARLGSIGVIHRNMSIENQVLNIKLVKSSPQSIWFEVLKAREEEPIESITFRMDEAGIGSAILFSGSLVSGIIVKSGLDQDYWYSKASSLISLLREYKPTPLLDEDGRLRVAAAISPFDERRIKALEEAGVDALVVDVAHAHNVNVISSVAKIVKNTSVDVIVGNIGTKSAVLDYLSKADGIAGFRVGIGSGSICLTAEVTGAFAPTLTAVLEAREALEELGAHGKIPLIADGGFRNVGDIAKALIAGASTAMTGRLLAGAEETPGTKVRVGGKVYKQYRGMASKGSIERRYAEDRYSKPSKGIEEGIEGLVPYRGSVISIVAELVAGLKAALGYAGAWNIESAWRGELARITSAGREEAKPHDMII